MMQTRDCACGAIAVRDEAALWFVRLQAAQPSSEERARFEAWCKEHPQHQYEFEVLQGVWSAADRVPRARLQALCETPSSPRRRPLLRYALAAGLLAVAVALGLFSGLSPSTDYRAEFASSVGERRHIALPDGSVIDLNSGSRVAVHFQSDRRSVDLQQGEAMFSVEHDSGRPFVVDAGPGAVTVTGTRFDVRRDASQTRVAVEAGTVMVQGRSDQKVSLTAGQGSRIDAQGQVSPAQSVNTQELTAWRTGKLVFSNASLFEVAEEVSRYRTAPLQVSDPAVGNLRLSSVFKSDDTDALLRALPSILPVAIKSLPDGRQEIIAR